MIRALGPADAPAFQALRLAALRECPSAFAASEGEERDTPLAAVAKRLQATADHVVFGAFDGAVLVGLLGWQRETPAKLAHKAFVWGVYVAPAWRRRGLARALLQQALDHSAAQPGLRQVNLGVNAANTAAIALYRTLGFETFGHERGFLCVQGVLHDELHMVRRLAG